MPEQNRSESERAYDRFKAAEKKELPTSPFAFDETMARVLRVKPESKPKKRKL